jgi:hypothetical protein
MYRETYIIYAKMVNESALLVARLGPHQGFPGRSTANFMARSRPSEKRLVTRLRNGLAVLAKLTSSLLSQTLCVKLGCTGFVLELLFTGGVLVLEHTVSANRNLVLDNCGALEENEEIFGGYILLCSSLPLTLLTPPNQCMSSWNIREGFDTKSFMKSACAATVALTSRGVGRAFPASLSMAGQMIKTSSVADMTASRAPMQIPGELIFVSLYHQRSAW